MHHHHHSTGSILKWSFFATLAFCVVELIAGLRSGSLALVSDAGHNFTDALALVLAAVAHHLQSRPANDTKTFGYHRAGVLAAAVNALTLVVIAGFIFLEAWDRFLHPRHVSEWTMAGVAALGVVVNGAIMWSLHRDKAHDLNIRAAFVHMLGDAVSSMGIVLGAIVIYFTGWAQVDPILSVLIGVLIIWTAWDIIKEALNILLEGLPTGMELAKITRSMQNIPGVIDVHDLHIWTLGSNTHSLSCHVLIEDMPPSASNEILERINGVLCDLRIRHTTIQFEHTPCAGCSMTHTAPHLEHLGHRH